MVFGFTKFWPLGLFVSEVFLHFFVSEYICIQQSWPSVFFQKERIHFNPNRTFFVLFGFHFHKNRLRTLKKHFIPCSLVDCINNLWDKIIFNNRLLTLRTKFTRFSSIFVPVYCSSFLFREKKVAYLFIFFLTSDGDKPERKSQDTRYLPGTDTSCIPEVRIPDTCPVRIPLVYLRYGYQIPARYGYLLYTWGTATRYLPRTDTSCIPEVRVSYLPHRLNFLYS